MKFCLNSVKQYKSLSIHQSRTKYNSVAEAYLSYAKTRKKSYKKGVRISRRLLHLLSKLITAINTIHKTNKFELTSGFQKQYNIIKRIFEQQAKLFNGEKVSERIISIY